MAEIVLDSSAALAHIFKETGGARVTSALRTGEQSFAMSSVNWCETLTRLQRDSDLIDGEDLSRMLPGVLVVAFEREHAEQAATFSRLNSSVSLGDRACLALAQSRKATIWTADRLWARMKTGVPMELIRQRPPCAAFAK